MAYIPAGNPGILSATGMDKGALVTVTAITAAMATPLTQPSTHLGRGRPRSKAIVFWSHGALAVVFHSPI